MSSEYTIKAFQGLDLRTDPEDVGETAAVDLLNVHLDHPEQIKTRPGWTPLSAAFSNDVQALGWFTDGSSVTWLVGSDSATLQPFKLDGTAGTTSTNTASTNNAFTSFGAPGATLLLVASGGAGLLTFDGTTWGTVAGLPAGLNPVYLTVTANDNRVVAANLTGSRVFFAAAGNYLSWGASDYVDLWPGDGEPITALVTWRDKVFAFKRSRFAVFANTGIDATGGAIFNYYGVATGHGAYYAGAAVAGDEGVYFLDGTSGDVYVTTGADPVYVSAQLEPWLRNETTGLPSRSGTPKLTYCDHHLYVSWSNCQAVLNTLTQRWTIWNLSVSAILGILPSRTVYFGEPASNKIAALTGTTDNGSAIPWHYTSGWYDMGAPGQEKIVGWSTVTGTGSVQLERFADYAAVDTNAATLTIGTTTSRVMHQKGWRGLLMQHKLSGTASGSVSSLSHAIRSVRAPGLRSS